MHPFQTITLLIIGFGEGILATMSYYDKKQLKQLKGKK